MYACVFIAQLVEHCSAIAEATGSNPVEAPKNVFSGNFAIAENAIQLLWSHFHFICIPTVYIISFCVSFLSRVDELNKLARLQCMGLHSSAGRALQRERRGHGFESRCSPEKLFQATSQLLKLQFTAMVTFSFHLYSRSSHHSVLNSYSGTPPFSRLVTTATSIAITATFFVPAKRPYS